MYTTRMLSSYSTGLKCALHISLSGKLKLIRIIMKLFQYLAIALALVLYCVENTYALGQHVCTFRSAEKIPGTKLVRKKKSTRKEKNKELTRPPECILSSEL